LVTKTSNKRMVLAIAALVQLTASNAFAGDVIIIAANLGGQAGKGLYCGYVQESAEMVALAASAIKEFSANERQEGKAVAQFMDTMNLAQQLGPQGESCSEFKVGFDQSLEILKSRYN